ncbi:DHA2 family efflux MFS transporter permease subunit [Amycolatopsis sp. CA-230715]|uniref:DHA2 family efflux MFS transporter permease subunit n=1 Tax=Amycolatopsis sp. CA-230715 TaxID=2745196 RepID=UPI001C32FB85|nr:DHA2 family efflux MFS transporter permease subunit [Amycolatopsis sp. CA-230715]QWF79492.1 Multidrug export protein EmrB [Amycolatopsis sp. CA-230715]
MSTKSSLEPIPRSAWYASAVIALGGFVANMDGPIVSIGLETMRHDLGATLDGVQWVVTGYLLGLSAALPVTPWLVRRFGAGRLWLLSLVAFLVLSAACALSPTLPALIAARVLQAVAGGVMVASGQTVIGIVVGPARMGRLMGTLGIVVGAAPLVGPSLGGLLLAHFAWPSLFWVNLPIGLVTVLLGLRLVPPGERGATARLDHRGLALATISVPLLVYALTELGGVHTGSAPLHWALLALSLVLGAVFVRRSRRVPNPVLALRLFRVRAISLALGSVLLSSAAMYGAIVLLPLWLQIRLGHGAASTGLLLVPLGLGTSLVMIVAGRLTDRYGGARIALAGTGLVLLSTLPFLWFGGAPSLFLVQALLFARGVGLGLSMMPASVVAYTRVSPDDLGDATVLMNIGMRIGGAVGGALVVIPLSRALEFGWAFVVLAGLSVAAVAVTAWLLRVPAREKTTGRTGK